MRLGEQNGAEKLRSLFLFYFIFLSFPLNPGLCGWRDGILAAPSTVGGFCGSSHTPCSAVRPSVRLQGRTGTSRIPDVPSAGRQTPRECSLPRSGWAPPPLGTRGCPSGAGRPAPHTHPAPLPTPCLLQRRRPLRAWLRAADAPAHLRLPQPDSPRLLGLTGSPNKVSGPRGRPALIPATGSKNAHRWTRAETEAQGSPPAEIRPRRADPGYVPKALREARREAGLYVTQ